MFITVKVFSSEKLTDFSCEKLIEKSKDSKFSLSTLAGLRAHKKCENFKYEWRNVSEFEKKLYSDELAEIDPNVKKPISEASIDELKAEVKNQKDLTLKFKAYKQLRQKYKNSGKKTEAITTATQLFTFAKKNWKAKKTDSALKLQYLEASLIQARILFNTDKIKQAREILKYLNEDLKNENLAESYFLSAKIFEDEKKYDLAIGEYDKALKIVENKGQPQGSGLDLNKLGWTKSWLLYKTDQWTQAEKSFKEFSESTQDQTEKTRADFFRARTLAKLEKPIEAKLVLKNIIAHDFYSYYALASYFILNENLPAISDFKNSESFKYNAQLDFLDQSKKNIFTDLIDYQEYDIAEKSIPLFSKTLDQNVQLSIYLAEKTQRYLPLFSSFAKLPNVTKKDILLTHSQLVFPRPFENEVKKMSEKTGLQTSLIYSIMKQESGFNEQNKSHADAYGLMQLIPRLAKSLAKKYEIEYRFPEDLYKPEINIPLGCFELKDQIKKQNGQLTFVAAAYNAGPGALSGWLKQRKSTEDIFDFVESIPYDETRTYVKIIARNKLFYERLESPKKSLPFPAEFVTEVAAESVSK